MSVYNSNEHLDLLEHQGFYGSSILVEPLHYTISIIINAQIKSVDNNRVTIFQDFMEFVNFQTIEAKPLKLNMVHNDNDNENNLRTYNIDKDQLILNCSNKFHEKHQKLDFKQINNGILDPKLKKRKF